MIFQTTVKLTREDDKQLRDDLRSVLRWWGPADDEDPGRKVVRLLARGQAVNLDSISEGQEWLADMRDWANADIETYTPGINSSEATPFGSVAAMSLTIVEARVEALKDIERAELALAEVLLIGLGVAR